MRTVRRLVTGLAGMVLVLLLASPTLAHAELVSATPEDGAVLDTPPTSIQLAFSEGLDAGKSSFTVSGPSGDAGTGRAAKDGAKVLRLDGLTLAAGEYVIKWVAAAEDGHIERGKLGFTVSESASATPAPAPTEAPTEAPAASAPAESAPAASAPGESAPGESAPAASAPAESAPASAAASPAPGTDGSPASSSGSDVLIPIIAGLVLVGLVGVFVLRRSRGA